jgi:methionine sulfoxide reductase heme-binding subunit
MPTAGSVIAITGVIATAALTAVVVLGILVHGKRQLPGLTRHAGMDWHRNLSLLAVVFLGVHVLAAVTTTEAGVSVAAVVVPFVSARQPLWIGLGAVSLDLLVAVTVTSLVRVRMGRRWWLAVHWLSYACWPAAMAHAIGIGPGMRNGRLLDLAVACIAAVVAAAAWRLAWALRAVPRARRVPDLMRALERTPPPAVARKEPASRSQGGRAPGDG